ncbi:UvrD/REP helicase [Desulfatibacillum aliphaticivorans]|uniref:DNA 3'-5' helicase II n=2 Tax=Desulfatibacillum aliphaticivorans TaxID=218208 RepID=B8FKF8_DESAL|nr:UvrD/REP helicase [Desulfatibacillum aliphaticivorans]
MENNAPFVPPEITDADIEWATELLGLPKNAFLGEDGDDPRKEVLKDMTTFDVSACPGSGKTTLLVAKLAILANKWSHRTSGICVLSHTNAARDEIEKRLGSSAVGRQLLNYPHYIGTIHGFVDQFLALPWLRSKNCPIKIIDTDICQNFRWKYVFFRTSKWSSQMQKILKEKSLRGDKILIQSSDFTLTNVKYGEKTKLYKVMKDSCVLSTEKGYFCFEEMFMWAKELMDTTPSIILTIRKRFPLSFIDEVQDNSDSQTAILQRIFTENGNSAIQQRFGDENQAIYSSPESQSAPGNILPIDEKNKKVLPNSHRFCQHIADLSGPLSMTADTCSLEGHGPKCRHISCYSEDGNHTIFLFDDNSINRVLDAFGHLLIATFSDESLRHGVFTAVGHIHKPKRDEPKPCHVQHYWPDYNPELCKKEPRPSSLLQYIHVGLGKSQRAGISHPAAEKIAEGLFRLAGMSENPTRVSRRGFCHRSVLKALENRPKAKGVYLDLLHSLVVDRNLPTRDEWKAQSPIYYKLASIIAEAPINKPEANSFLQWHEFAAIPQPDEEPTTCMDNIYRYSHDGREVPIRVGSIHSVKGETHTATLVLETYWHKHNLESIFDWICDNNAGCCKKEKRNNPRLKTHYVAMTRPTHLLCLAMKKSCFEDQEGNLNQEKIDKLTERGWKYQVV